MKATIASIGPGYQFHGECDICTGREGRRYDAQFHFSCGGLLKGTACSPCWKKYTPGQVVDLQGVSEHSHLNDEKRVWPTIGQARDLFMARAREANLVGEPGGTEYEVVQPEKRARIYRHYGEEPCPWTPAPIPEPVTGDLLTVLKGTLGYLEDLPARPDESWLQPIRVAIARAERR